MQFDSRGEIAMITEFISRLQDGPSLLFLGQNYLKLESGKDAFLNQIIEKYGGREANENTYFDILGTGLIDAPEEAIAWMQRRSMYSTPPNQLQVIGGYSWNGIFTSAIDDILERTLRTDWRQIQPVFNEKYIPSDPRSRLRLHIWHIYGGVSSPDLLGYPPLDQEQLWAKHGTAVVLAKRIPELATPLGTLVIDGYSPDDDWFSSERMYSVLSDLLPGQTYWFNAPDTIHNDQYFQPLIQQGKLIVYKESLAQVFSSAAELGTIRLSEPPEEAEFGHKIRVNGKSINLPPNLWMKMTEISHLLPESVFLPLTPMTDENKYLDFRDFLYNSSVCPPWTGYARGFAFERDFEAELRKAVSAKLSSAKQRNNTLILSGQTGTGKTVSLGHLAYNVQKEGRWPVVFIDRLSRFNRESLDGFCEWVELNRGQATLIIWDGMQTPDEYTELLQYLLSRGRNIVLIGSCYVLDQEEFSYIELIKAPANLNNEELTRFTDFLNNIDPDLHEYLSKFSHLSAPSFLVFLYRLLPHSRPSIKKGLEQELMFAENIITSKVSEKKMTIEATTILQEALLKAGLISSTSLIQAEPRKSGKETITELQELIGLVMVPGQFSIACPFELLVRTLGKPPSSDFIDLLKTVDIFRWGEDSIGNITIEPRTPLEAQLITKARLGGPQTEIEYVIKLLKSIREGYLIGQTEINFAISLIKSVGPNSSNPTYFKRYFLRLAETLKIIRTSGIIHHRLLLQESLLCRESAKIEDYNNQLDSLLHQSEEACIKALSLIKDIPESRFFRSRVHAELASSYGQQATHTSDENLSIILLNKAHKECYYAHNLDPQNFAPIDVVAWTTRDLLLSFKLNDEERASLQVDVMHAFDLADSEGFQGEALNRLNKRKEEIFNIFGDYTLSDQAFDRLLESDSCIGIYARAQRMVPFIYTEEVFSAIQREESKKAFNYLKQYKNIIKKDSKCLLLQLRVWWTWKTGKKMATGERSVIPLSEENWQQALDQIAQLLSTEELENNLKFKYFEALCYFHLDQYHKSLQLYKLLDYESQSYVSRIIKHHVWADSHGEPHKANGIIAWLNAKGTGEIHVSAIQARIRFLERDTGRVGLKVGDSLDNFRIAFSFRGPIADFME